MAKKNIEYGELNKVILIGGNHHNGLGLVRSFGVNGINPYGIIIGNDAEKGFCRKSKYWKNTWAVKTSHEAVEILVREFSNEKLKPVVIPYSDGASAIIDRNLNVLSYYFKLPSIKGKEGAIFELMNKQKQIDFAKHYNIKILKAVILEEENFEQQLNLEFPLIIKPVLSVEGHKSDITICSLERDYWDTIANFRAKGYKRIIVQKYLMDKHEYVLTGAIFKDKICFDLVRHIRQWPVGMGSGSFSEFVTDIAPIEFAKKIMKDVLTAGYEGPIDIEFFQDDKNEFYLNEINWRSSGRNFVSLYTDNHTAFQYYCYQAGLDADMDLVNRRSGYIMNEGTDIRHIFLSTHSNPKLDFGCCIGDMDWDTVGWGGGVYPSVHGCVM